MPPGGPVFCPDCGAKNKAGWEFCARCGASLQGAAAARPSAAAAPVRPESQGPSVGTFLGALAAVALVGAAYFLYRGQAGGPPPSSDIFTVPTQPTPPPAGPAAESIVSEPHRLARERLSRGDREGALQLLAEGVSATPDDHALRAFYAKVLWQDGRREEALEQLRAAAGGERAFAVEYARALVASGRPAEAVEQYRLASERSPNDHDVLQGLGQALLEAQRPAEAVEPLRRLVELNPGEVLAAQQLGAALEGAGDGAGAVATYRGVLERMPGATLARGRLAEVLQAQGQGPEAIALLQEGLQTTPQSPVLHRSLGSVLDRSGRKEEAAAAYREFLRLAPNDAAAPIVQQRLSELGVKPVTAS